jgi:hypothetical protein
MAEASELHADDFELVTPSGDVMTKGEYLGRVASSDIDYRRFEVASEIDVAVSGDLAVLRYQSMVDIAVVGQEAGELACWHIDCYQRTGRNASWRVRWSQATASV